MKSKYNPAVITVIIYSIATVYKNIAIRFKGVGIDCLSHYLGWRRLFETSEVSTCYWMKLAMGINNS